MSARTPGADRITVELTRAQIRAILAIVEPMVEGDYPDNRKAFLRLVDGGMARLRNALRPVQ